MGNVGLFNFSLPFVGLNIARPLCLLSRLGNLVRGLHFFVVAKHVSHFSLWWF